MVFESGAVGTFVFSDAVASPHNFEAASPYPDIPFSAKRRTLMCARAYVAGENPMVPYKGENVYTFLGTQGTASFPELRVHRYSAGGDWTDEFVTEPATKVERIPPFTRQLQHFAQVCRGKEEPRCSALEALKTIILVEAVRKSMDTGTAVEVAQDL
jgi:predicted dehydrogenase